MIDRSNREKLYIQLKGRLRENISSGRWQAGQQIPTESVLCGMFEVSKMTVRQAISGLVDEGLLNKVQGKGTFVVADAQAKARVPSLTMKTRLTDDIGGHEVPIRIKVIFNRPYNDRLDQLGKHEEVVQVRRLRLVGEEPVLLEDTYVPLEICPTIAEVDLSDRSIYSVLASKATLQIARAVKTFEIGRLSAEDSELLLGEEGERALVVHRTLVSSSGQPIAYTRSVTISEKYKFQTVYERI